MSEYFILSEAQMIIDGLLILAFLNNQETFFMDEGFCEVSTMIMNIN